MPAPGHGMAATLAASAAALWIAVYAAAARLPDHASGIVTAVFLPGTAPETAVNVIVAAGGYPIGEFTSWIWKASASEAGFAGRLRAHGALLALRELPAAPGLAGCFGGVAARPVSIPVP